MKLFRNMYNIGVMYDEKEPLLWPACFLNCLPLHKFPVHSKTLKWANYMQLVKPILQWGTTVTFVCFL